MKYTLLSHLYYEDKEKCQELYLQRFHGESTVHLDFEIKGYPAFYCINPENHRLYRKILTTNRRVCRLKECLPAVALNEFSKRSLVEEIVLTNNIEGVHSTRREINGVLNDLRNNKKKKRFYGLVNKYNMMTGDELPLESSADIRQIYNDLVYNEVAEDDPSNIPDGKLFRKELAEVTSITNKVIHQGVMPEEMIIDHMDRALKILNEDPTDIERIAIFHYLFGFIHPFYDGNGRTSRFICSYLLSKALENELIGYRLSYTVKENVGEYYRAFKICNDEKNKGDLTPFVTMFLKIIARSMENLETALAIRLGKLTVYMERIGRLQRFTQDELDGICYIMLQASLFSEEGITKKELGSTMKISPSTVDKKIDIIRRAGYLKERKIGHTLYFEFDIEKL